MAHGPLRGRLPNRTLQEGMLNDALLSGSHEQGSVADRRRSPRTVSHAELIMHWHHDPGTPVRYPILDVSDDGLRIQSATPLFRGMSGTAVKILPEGRTLNRMCTVTRLRPPAQDGGPFEIGLLFA